MWPNDDGVVDWVRSVAQPLSIVIVKKRSWKNESGRKCITLACERYGQTRKRTDDDDDEVDGKKKRRTKTKKCGCGFELYVWEKPKDEWHIRVKNGMHNHDLSKSLEGHSFVGRMTPMEKQIVREMSAAGAAPRDILSALRQRDETNVTSSSQVWNQRYLDRVKAREGRTEVQQFLYLLTEYGYYHVYRTVPGTDEVSDILFAPKESLELVKLFPYVMVMDATYKTNK